MASSCPLNWCMDVIHVIWLLTIMKLAFAEGDLIFQAESDDCIPLQEVSACSWGPSFARSVSDGKCFSAIWGSNLTNKVKPGKPHRKKSWKLGEIQGHEHAGHLEHRGKPGLAGKRLALDFALHFAFRDFLDRSTNTWPTVIQWPTTWTGYFSSTQQGMRPVHALWAEVEISFRMFLVPQSVKVQARKWTCLAMLGRSGSVTNHVCKYSWVTAYRLFGRSLRSVKRDSRRRWHWIYTLANAKHITGTWERWGGLASLCTVPSLDLLSGAERADSRARSLHRSFLNLCSSFHTGSSQKCGGFAVLNGHTPCWRRPKVYVSMLNTGVKAASCEGVI